MATRKIDKRRELCDYLLKKLEGGALGDVLDASIEKEEWALFLQGVFFTTGTVGVAGFLEPSRINRLGINILYTPNLLSNSSAPSFRRRPDV